MAILRIPRSDDTSSFVLLNITPTSTDSPTLDGKIAGTDGSSAFILQLKPALAARARAAKAACSEEGWTTILKSTLLDGLTPKDVEITATVDGEKEIQIVFRKTFQGGLKQRLGSLHLKGDADEEIELFEWCGAMAKQAAEQGKALQQEKQKLGKLVKETQDLIKAKEEAEREVIGKCLRLVNSKKEKIQELQARLSHYEEGDPPRNEPMQIEEPAEEEAPKPAKRGRGKAAAKGKGKEKEPTMTTLLPRRGKRAAPDPEPEEEGTEPPKDEDNVDMDQDEEDVETEGEDTPSDHSVEAEVPEVRTRAESQDQSQIQRCSQKTASPAEEEDDGPHVTTRVASHSQHQNNAADKGEGSETESDDEL